MSVPIPVKPEIGHNGAPEETLVLLHVSQNKLLLWRHWLDLKRRKDHPLSQDRIGHLMDVESGRID